MIDLSRSHGILNFLEREKLDQKCLSWNIYSNLIVVEYMIIFSLFLVSSCFGRIIFFVFQITLLIVRALRRFINHFANDDGDCFTLQLTVFFGTRSPIK